MTNENGDQSNNSSLATTAWNSIYLCTLFTFSTSFQFTMFMTSLWPFMKILDNTVAESFYGMVLALYSVSQIIASPLLGYWSNRVQSHKMPLIFCNLMLLLSNLLYACFELFHSQRTRRVALCMSRFIAGVGWAQLGLLKAYVAAASLVSDRSRAIALITGGFAMGVILGPALQTLFTLVDYPGFTICVTNSRCLNVSMFTVPAIFASLVNALLMLLLLTQFRESHVAISERAQLDKANVMLGQKVSSTKLPPYDRFAVFVCCALRFTQFFVFTIMETIGTAFAMLMFNWSPFEVVFYDSLAHAVRGVVALLVYMAYIIFDLGKKLNDRIVCLLSLAALLLFHLVTYSWPFIPNQVQLINNKNASTNLGGCDLAKNAWCAGLTRVSPWLYYGAMVLLIGPAFPNINVAMNTLFSRIIGPRMQSMQQGMLEMHGAFGRLFGPLLISFFYTSHGVRLIWMLEMCQITFMIIVWLMFYSRLVPLRISNA